MLSHVSFNAGRNVKCIYYYTFYLHPDSQGVKEEKTGIRIIVYFVILKAFNFAKS
jgi:hypothetical protein